MDTLVVSAEKNVSGADRSGAIIVKATAYDRAEAIITVNQSQYQGTVIDLGKIEIWKDNVIEYTTEKSVVDYSIQVDSKRYTREKRTNYQAIRLYGLYLIESWRTIYTQRQISIKSKRVL